MPLNSREAFGLFQQVVASESQKAEMLRVGLAGYQQALQENDQLLKENESLKQQLGSGQAGAKPTTSVTPFPQPAPGTPPIAGQ